MTQVFNKKPFRTYFKPEGFEIRGNELSRQYIDTSKVRVEVANRGGTVERYE